ncbi:MAG: [FeFe] hydrogenase H-cluster maturation GTPase HydF [Alphaproteobacteria bacterium]|nr:[FeFe] hydrogenase H-cluster maturation GTPase HydF [Alphaproteobacteria bacterium]
MNNKTPRGSRLAIAIIGRRNTGKSSLINALTNEDIAIVSDTPGTTTDPIAKSYELLPYGPVTFFDTAGLDDEGEIGNKRVAASKKILFRTDIAVLVTDEKGITDYEQSIIKEIEELKIPYVVAFNKTDINESQNISSDFPNALYTSAKTGKNIDELKDLIISSIPHKMKTEPVLAGDLFSEGDTVICVTPIDLAAPKGRLIVPQMQMMREILDNDAIGILVKERELEKALDNLKHPPKLVVTDSQAILKVSGDVPNDVPLTTFSIIYARFKGDLDSLIDGANAIDNLKDGDKVLIGEACSHHPQADDIGRIKIPRWLSQYTGCKLNIDVFSGHDFPEDLENYKLLIHCGACMLNRVEMLRRIRECTRRKIPITNYGVAISKLQGVLDRAIKPFRH